MWQHETDKEKELKRIQFDLKRICSGRYGRHGRKAAKKYPEFEANIRGGDIYGNLKHVLEHLEENDFDKTMIRYYSDNISHIDKCTIHAYVLDDMFTMMELKLKAHCWYDSKGSDLRIHKL